MPADASKRRKRREAALDDYEVHAGHAREVELRRSRGEISCAECRRLKIKCDKQIPCQSCQRRGCAALCPNGSLATGEGTRFVLAATEHLHNKIGKMRGRIRQLEDALAKAQAASTDEQHPLLHEDLISFDKEDDDPLADDTYDAAPPAVPVDRLGLLSITDDGISKFFGATGTIESILVAETDSTPTDSPRPSSASCSPHGSLSPDLARSSAAFPFAPGGPPGALRAHLPPHARALFLARAYFAQAAWLFRSVTEAQLVDEMIPAIYNTPNPSNSNTPSNSHSNSNNALSPSTSTSSRGDSGDTSEAYTSPHGLALLFGVLAVGALVDVAGGAHENEAEAARYHTLARAALGAQSVFEKPGVVTIQALHLQSIYAGMAGREGGEVSLETSWSLLKLAAQLAYTIGLHRDGARWGLPEKWVQRRRICFWDLYVADTWSSLSTGRPPVLLREYADTHFPPDHEAKVNEHGHLDPGYQSWNFHFTSECLSEVQRCTLAAEPPTYQAILDLDRRIRDFALPGGAGKARDTAESMQRFVMSHSKEVILLYIHRSFFAQAIADDPANPLKSAYAHSFLSACKSSATILKMIQEQYAAKPLLCARFWHMWTFAFTAAIVFGTVVTHGPRSPLAPSATTEFEQACDLFTRASKHSHRAAQALPILLRIREKARAALADAKKDPGAAKDPGPADLDDALSVFAGRTKVLGPRRREPASPSLDMEYVLEGERERGEEIWMAPGPADDYAAGMAAGYAPEPYDPQDARNGQASSSSYDPQDPRRSNGHRPSYSPQDPTNGQASSSSSYDPRHLPPSNGHPPSVPTVPSNGPPPGRYSESGHYTYPQHQDTMAYGIWAPPPPPPPPQQYAYAQHHLQQQQEPDPRAHHHQPDPRTHHQQPPRAHHLHHHQHHQPQPQQAYAYDDGQARGYLPTQALPQAQAYELAALGLASREAKLDERWASFMHESGYL